MKFLFRFAFVLAFSLAAAQTQVTDSAQHVLPGRVNAAESLEKPYVILISADGFRYDYAEKYHAENLLKFANSGARAAAMLPSFPSITFPNHWSLITGLYPSHHGLVDNFFYDYRRKEFYAMSDQKNAEDGSWYGGTPLWSLAEKQGMLSASLQWVGSASDAGEMRPTYYYHYHEKFTPEDKVKKVINWLKLPAEKRPHFISLYFPEADSNGHYYGPESTETGKAVRLIDAAIGKLVAEATALNLPNVNFIFVSDHGMIKVDNEHPLAIPEVLLNKEKFDIFNSQTLLRVIVKNPSETKVVYHELKKNKTADYNVYLNRRLPKYLHYGLKDDRYNRIGQILLVPKSPKIFLEKGKTTKNGKHGYDPKITPQMKAVFYSWGPQIRENVTIGEFSNVNVYPFVAEMLGLKIAHQIDGKPEVLQKILK